MSERHVGRLLLFLGVCLLGLSGCSTVPGLSLISDWRDFKTLESSGGNVSLEKLREIEARPLVAEKGISFDVGLLRRTVAQLLLNDVTGLRHSKDLALEYAEQDTTKAIVVSSLAGVEILRMNYRAALKEYAETEILLKKAARQANQSLIEFEPFYSFIPDYLSAADAVEDKVLSNRLLRDYLNPIATSPRTSPAHRLYFNTILSTREMSGGRGDAYTRYLKLESAIAGHEATIASLVKPDPLLLRTLNSQLNMLRLAAGQAALSAGLYLEAGEELKSLKRRQAADRSQPDIGLAASIAELEWGFYFALGDYEASIRIIDETWSVLPPAFKLEDTIFPLNYISYKAGFQAAAGEWAAAEQTLADLPIKPADKSITLVDYFVGVRALVHAVLGDPARHLHEFAARDKKYKALSGTDLGLGHAAAKAIIYYRQASLTGSLADYQKVVEGGREMSRTLRAFQKSGYGQVSTFAPSIIAMAKEAYVAAASALLTAGGAANANDLLDALHLLYATDTDRDIAAMMARTRTIPGLSQNQVRQIQDAQRAVRAAQQNAAQLARIQDMEPAVLEQASAQVRAASRQLDALLDELSSIPAFQQAFGDTEPPAMKSIQARLMPGESLALLAPLADATLVMVISGKTYSQRLVKVSKARIAPLVERIRQSVSFEADSLPEFDTVAASDLYRILLGWNPSLLANTRSLTVIANGPLAAIPFGLLVTQPPPETAVHNYRDTPWLIRSMAIAHAPSIRSWYAVTSPQQASTSRGFIAWAHPAFGGQATQVPSDRDGTVVRSALPVLRGDNRSPLDGLPANLGQWLPPLPETLGEASSIAQALGSSPGEAVIHGLEATRSSVLERSDSGDLAKYNVVMFATHGLMPAQVSGLYQPALVLAPEPDEPNPSLLQLQDVLALRLKADWVVLSACNTAAADKLGGDPLSGLARGFFYAGAKSMLVTHWEVESQSATAITTRTMLRYVSDRNLGRAQALQQTAIDMIEGSNSPQAWAHPAYWAPYALVGNGRRGAGL